MSPRFTKVERVLESRAALGEGAMWSARDTALYWVDITRCELHRLDPSSGADRRWIMPSQIGCCAPMDDGCVLVALESGFHAFDPVSGDLAFAGRPDEMPPGSRFNDGTVDPAGRFLAGTLPKAGPGAVPQGSLYVLEGAAPIRCLERDLMIQNGLAFGPDGHTLYLSDSGAAVRSVWRYDYDPDTGRCSHRRLHFDMHGTPGRPDGAAVDVDGGYWIAAVDGWALVRLTPAGRVDRVIDLPVQKPSKPAFGGPDRRTLFVTSISQGLNRADPRHREAGNLFAVEAGAQGVPVGPASHVRVREVGASQASTRR